MEWGKSFKCCLRITKWAWIVCLSSLIFYWSLDWLLTRLNLIKKKRLSQNKFWNSLFFNCLSHDRDSNPGPFRYEWNALPTELLWHLRCKGNTFERIAQLFGNIFFAYSLFFSAPPRLKKGNGKEYHRTQTTQGRKMQRGSTVIGPAPFAYLNRVLFTNLTAVSQL